MKLIKNIFLSLAVLMPGLAWSQDEGEVTPPDPNARTKIEAARIALITDRLGLTPEQAEKFWPIYREFAMKRRELVGQYKLAQRDINPNNPDPKKQEGLVELGLKIKQQELDLEKDYSGRLLKIISAQQMLNLRGAEKEFQRMIINQLQQRRMMQQRQENFRDKNQRLRRRN